MQFRPFNIGKYQFIELLGRGGMAEVYLVKTIGPGNFQKQFAVKRILPGNWTNPKLIERFEQEARLTSILNHPNIIQVFDFFRTSDTYFLVMEYVDGLSLYGFLRRGVKPSFELAVYLLNEVCKGLDYAHRKQDPDTGKPLHIIHRDISPGNILLSREGGVKLCDFGIAKARAQVHRTETDQLLGKAPYMSPEQARGETLDHRSDIFSTAAVLWELVLGRKLFQGDSDLMTLRMVQDCIVPRPSALDPGIPKEIESILQVGLSSDPDARFESVADLQEALQEFLASRSPALTQRRFAEMVKPFFDPTSRAPTAEDLEVVPFFPREEEGLLSGLQRLGEVSTGAETAPLVAATRPAAPAPAPAPIVLDRTPRLRPPPVREEEAPLFPARGRSRAALLFGLLVSIVMAAGYAFHAELFALLATETAEAPRLPRNCVIAVRTTPPGADVTSDGSAAGKTPFALSAPCGSARELAVALPGYRPFSRRVTLAKASDALDIALDTAVPGKLEVSSDRTVKIYVDEKYVTLLQAHEPFQYPLYVGNTYHFIFTDETTGKSKFKTYSATSEGASVKDTVEFGD